MKPIRPEDCDTIELRRQLSGGCSPSDGFEGPRERRLPRNRTLGSLRLLEHCEFAWHQDEGDPRRVVLIDGTECRRCVEELVAMTCSDLVIDRRAR